MIFMYSSSPSNDMFSNSIHNRVYTCCMDIVHFIYEVWNSVTSLEIWHSMRIWSCIILPFGMFIAWHPLIFFFGKFDFHTLRRWLSGEVQSRDYRTGKRWCHDGILPTISGCSEIVKRYLARWNRSNESKYWLQLISKRFNRFNIDILVKSVVYKY